MTDSPVAGITYRQLDYWARRGYLNIQPVGSGHRRDWPQDELAVAQRMGRLVAVGIPPDLASSVARGITNIGGGIHITLDDETTP